MRGYATPAERHAKALRLQVLQARLARVDRQLAAGTVSVVRGGRALLRKRGNLAAAGLDEDQWRRQWASARLFLTADGEKDKAWGNETIRWHPGQGWLEIKLPVPLAHLANRPHGRYRLSCPVPSPTGGRGRRPGGHGRGPLRHQPRPGIRPLVPRRVMEDPPGTGAALEELRRHPVVALDVNAGHLAVAVVAADGNVMGTPATIGLDLAGLPAATRDGRLRAAITTLIATAKEHGARAIVIEDLDFAEASVRGTRAPREPPVPRPAGPGLPAAGGRHPDREAPRPAGADGRHTRACT